MAMTTNSSTSVKPTREITLHFYTVDQVGVWKADHVG